MQDNAFTNKVKQFWAFIKRMAARAWAYLKVARMEWIVMIGLFAADLISKAIVGATVEYGATVVIIPKFLNVHNIHNYAAAFGGSFLKDLLGEIGARIFFSVFAVAASVAFVLVLIKNKGKSKWFRVSIAMFVAGAMGNCIDRMFLGYVRDFIEFEYFGLTIWGRKTWYVFNIADAELVVGVIMLVIYFLFMYKDTGKKKDQAELLTDELGDVDPSALEHGAEPRRTVSDGTQGNDDAATADGDGAENTENTENTEHSTETDVLSNDNISDNRDTKNSADVQPVEAENTVESAGEEVSDISAHSETNDDRNNRKRSGDAKSAVAENGAAAERVGRAKRGGSVAASDKPKTAKRNATRQSAKSATKEKDEVAP